MKQIHDIDCLDRESHYQALADVVMKTKPDPCSVRSDLIRAVTEKQDTSNSLVTVFQLVSSGLICFCIAMVGWQGWVWRRNLSTFEERETSVYYRPTAYYETRMNFRASAYGPGPSRWEYTRKRLAPDVPSALDPSGVP